MKHRASIRLKLIVLYLITIIFPVLIIVFFMPAYYQKLITHETETLTEAALVALTGNIETYLDDLERMTVTPYLNDEIMFALKLKGNGLYDKADAYTKYKAETALYKTLPDSLENIRKDIVGTLRCCLLTERFISKPAIRSSFSPCLITPTRRSLGTSRRLRRTDGSSSLRCIRRTIRTKP
ncbi:hypothetical protein LJK87_31520 [Paenibacillus sp. P25]|nr:hypothetical protein LJK87_31520 [Paenibacillus sp. P25]